MSAGASRACRIEHEAAFGRPFSCPRAAMVGALLRRGLSRLQPEDELRIIAGFADADAWPLGA